MNVDERAQELLDEWCEAHDLDESHPHWHAMCLWAHAVACCELGNRQQASQWATMASAAVLLSRMTGGHTHYHPE